jgi:hypothetical protein
MSTLRSRLVAIAGEPHLAGAVRRPQLATCTGGRELLRGYCNLSSRYRRYLPTVPARSPSPIPAAAVAEPAPVLAGPAILAIQFPK